MPVTQRNQETEQYSLQDTHTYTHAHAHAHAHTHTHTHTHAHTHTHTHTHVSSKSKEIHDRVDTRVQLVWRLRVMGSCQYINCIHRRPRRGKL